MANVLKTTIKLRRDTLGNFVNKGSHVPLSGEVCLVDTLSRGLRVKVGDGVKTFNALPFLDEDNPAVVLGYLYGGKFYKDIAHTQEIKEYGTNVVYIDVPSSIIYYFDGTNLKESKVNIPNASAETAGILKLYETSGTNTDGTMTQKVITEAISAIVFEAIDSDSDSNDKCLNLVKPW